MKTEEKSKLITGQIFENRNKKLVIGSIEGNITSTIKYLHYYIDGHPYKCVIDDYEYMIDSFMKYE